MFEQWLHYIDSKSDKLYYAASDGVTVWMKWGRRGSELQKDQKDFGSPNAARIFFEEKVASKIAKGYKRGKDPLPAPQWNNPKPWVDPWDEKPILAMPKPKKVWATPKPPPKPEPPKPRFRRFQVDD